MSRLREPPCHLELFGDWSEMLTEVGEWDVEVFGIEFDAHEEQSGFLVGMLVGVQDVAVVAEDEVGDGCDFALGVGTTDEEDGGGFHSASTIMRATEANEERRF